jgi:purine-binding chemotaxis protein CheW
MSTGAQGMRQYATFVVAGFYFGIEVLEVQEVLREQRVTHVPFAPYAVAGLINLRGQIVPVVDMRALLHLAPREDSTVPPSVVLRTVHGAVSLLVDEIQDVLELDSVGYEPPPLNMEHDLLPLVQGIHKLDDRLLMVLDAQRAAGAGAIAPGTLA